MVVLFVLAMLGGGLNAVAGGGGFLTFPALVLMGVPPVPANATSIFALWPASLVSAAAYRRDLRPDRLTLLLGLASAIGGAAGSIALLRTPNATFRAFIPWLLLAATALFIANAPLMRWLRARGRFTGDPTPRTLAAIAVAQLAIAFYGGYFGAGIGIFMLTAFGFMGLTNIHAMNGLKTLLASFINGVSVAAFVLAGVILWSQALVMTAGAVIGGYMGATFAQRLDPRAIRTFVGAVGIALTVYFFLNR